MPAMKGLHSMNSDTMNGQLAAVMQRRSELLAAIASQRGQMAEIGTQLQTPLTLVDRGIAVVRFLRSNPVLVAGVVAVLVIRRRGVAGMLSGALRAWRGYRYFAAIASRYLQ
jgi:hypothetical protein